MTRTLLALTLALIPVILPAKDKPPTVRPGKNWEEAIAEFEAAAEKNPPPRGAVLFTGASNITRWKTLHKDFPKHQVINRGFGGSRMSDALRYADRVVIPYRPRLVILQAGGNDVRAGRAPDDVVADFQMFVTKVRAALPQVRLAYLSIPSSPVNLPKPEPFLRVNAQIAEFIKTQDNMRYIDCWNAALDAAGNSREELYEKDRLHNNAEGYKLYVKIITPYLEEP